MRKSPLVHTFSIVARDPQTGCLGVAVQSHWFSVGSVVAWAEPGVGAIATQAMVDISYGPLGLDLLRAGKPASQALAALLVADQDHALRQVAMVDAGGRVAAHTGQRCIAAAGHIAVEDPEQGGPFSVQANMMANPAVWPAMAEAYRSSQGDLAERMLAALEAAQEAGGDVRGQQSACLKMVGADPSGHPWTGMLMDLRVEDHPAPIQELRRLVHVQRAYHWMNLGDERLGKGQIEDALQAYRTAAELAPEIAELPFWHAVTLADLGRLEEALPIFQQVFHAEPAWAVLLERLPAAGLLKDDPPMIERIRALIQ